MKELALAQIHKALGARMAEFAGFNMPIYYTKGITEEHLQVRNKVGCLMYLIWENSLSKDAKPWH